MFKLAFVLLLTFCAASSQAHYLWVTVEKTAAGPAAVKIYFEEGPGPGDGHYLDPIFMSNKTWVRTVEQPEPKTIAVEDIRVEDKNQRWLLATVTPAAPRSIDVYGKFGVYRYGKTDVLLHYYARTLDITAHDDLHELDRAEKTPLDIVPHDFGSQMTLTVRWHGEPASDRMIYIRGPKGFRKNMKTDENGQVEFKIEGQGRFTFRTNVEEDKQGQDGGKSYALIRHHATLVMRLPFEK